MQGSRASHGQHLQCLQKLHVSVLPLPCPSLAAVLSACVFQVLQLSSPLCCPPPPPPPPVSTWKVLTGCQTPSEALPCNCLHVVTALLPFASADCLSCHGHV